MKRKLTLSTSNIMVQVCLALVPGAAAMIWFFGAGIAINLVAATTTAVATEAALLRARSLPVRRILDGSALLTGLLLGLCLPPLVPVHIPVIGAALAIALGKHLYGGLGQNPFNPAMVGYAVLIVAFPLAISLWPLPGDSLEMRTLVSMKAGYESADGVARATPLDAFKFRGSATVDEFTRSSDVMGNVGGIGWVWINLGFLAGGLYLAYQRLCDRLMPAVMLGTLVALSILFYDSGSSGSLGSPMFHLLSGSTMLAAFFIITDPVSSPNSVEAKVVYAVGIGAVIFLIRSMGAYPDGTAFAVLLMNTATPFLDQLRWRFA